MAAEPKTYRKRQVSVMAYLWDGEAFCPSHMPPGTIHSVYDIVGGGIRGKINTVEGQYMIEAGTHYIVGPGAAGEFWPVRKDIFEATYESA